VLTYFLLLDKLKNYLFSTIDISQDMPDKFIDKLDEQWEKIGVNIFGKNYTDYLLTEWNSRHKKVRQNLLFKSIKKEITNDTPPLAFNVSKTLYALSSSPINIVVNKVVRQNLLFKSIKKEITNDTLARKYLNQLSSHCYLYAALINPEEEFWKDFPEYKEIKRFLIHFRIR
jgi:predicted RNA-binding protein YlxR (DUF448 family)